MRLVCLTLGRSDSVPASAAEFKLDQTTGKEFIKVNQFLVSCRAEWCDEPVWSHLTDERAIMSLDFEEAFSGAAGETPTAADKSADQVAKPDTGSDQGAPSDEDGGEAVVSKNFRIQGDLNCHDVLRIEGYVEGNIECRTLTVAESARIKGNIRAKTIQMSGKVIGTIEAGSLTLNEKAMVSGDLVVHESLGIEPGAHFEGSCKRASARKGAAAKTDATKANAAQAPRAKAAVAKTPAQNAPSQNAPETPAIAAE